MSVAGSGTDFYFHVAPLPLSPPTTPAFSPSMRAVSKATAATANDEHDALQKKIEQRATQIIFGKLTAGYSDMNTMLELGDTRPRPTTPRIDEKKTKREFDNEVRAWRVKLHRWDLCDVDKEEWPSPALMYALTKLKNSHSAADPRDLVQGENKAPPLRVLSLIEEFFSTSKN